MIAFYRHSFQFYLAAGIIGIYLIIPRIVKAEDLNDINLNDRKHLFEASIVYLDSTAGIGVNYFINDNFSIGFSSIKKMKEQRIYGDYNFQMEYQGNVIFDFQNEEIIDDTSVQSVVFLRYYFQNPYNVERENIQFYNFILLGRNFNGWSYRKDFSYFMYFQDNPASPVSDIVWKTSHLTLEHNQEPYNFASLGLGIQFFFRSIPEGFFFNVEMGYTHYFKLKDHYYAYNGLKRMYLGNPMSVEDLIINRELYKLNNSHSLFKFFIIPWFGYRIKF